MNLLFIGVITTLLLFNYKEQIEATSYYKLQIDIFKIGERIDSIITYTYNTKIIRS